MYVLSLCQNANIFAAGEFCFLRIKRGYYHFYLTVEQILLDPERGMQTGIYFLQNFNL